MRIIKIILFTVCLFIYSTNVFAIEYMVFIKHSDCSQFKHLVDSLNVEDGGKSGYCTGFLSQKDKLKLGYTGECPIQLIGNPKAKTNKICNILLPVITAPYLEAH